IGLGSVHFRLKANKRTTVVLLLSRAGRRLLVAHRSVKAQVTLTLVDVSEQRTVARRTVTFHGSAALR
ncbi:MAG: hypothetical protein WAK93_16910, partial [Solirubrobacteraceae bacterium]